MIDLAPLPEPDAWEFVTLAAEAQGEGPSDPDRYRFLCEELERRTEAARLACVRVEGLLAGFTLGRDIGEGMGELGRRSPASSPYSTDPDVTVKALTHGAQ